MAAFGSDQPPSVSLQSFDDGSAVHNRIILIIHIKSRGKGWRGQLRFVLPRPAMPCQPNLPAFPSRHSPVIAFGCDICGQGVLARPGRRERKGRNRSGPPPRPPLWSIIAGRRFMPAGPHTACLSRSTPRPCIPIPSAAAGRNRGRTLWQPVRCGGACSSVASYQARLLLHHRLPRVAAFLDERKHPRPLRGARDRTASAAALLVSEPRANGAGAGAVNRTKFSGSRVHLPFARAAGQHFRRDMPLAFDQQPGEILSLLFRAVVKATMKICRPVSFSVPLLHRLGRVRQPHFRHLAARDEKRGLEN